MRSRFGIAAGHGRARACICGSVKASNLPLHEMFAFCKVARSHIVPIGQKDGISIFVGNDGRGVGAHVVRAVKEVRHVPEAFGLLLSAKHFYGWVVAQELWVGWRLRQRCGRGVGLRLVFVCDTPMRMVPKLEEWPTMTQKG